MLSVFGRTRKAGGRIRIEASLQGTALLAVALLVIYGYGRWQLAGVLAEAARLDAREKAFAAQVARLEAGAGSAIDAADPLAPERTFRRTSAMKAGVPQRGFTLIELAAAIAILGILAGFALPKFVALRSQARVSATQALGGSVRSAAALAHAMWLAADRTSPVTMDGASVTLTAEGYPTAADVAKTLSDSTGFTGDISSTGAYDWTKDGAGDSAHCRVTYRPQAGLAPTIVVETTGC